MPHVNGIATAGVTEATRLAQSVVHRGAEAAALVAAGRNEDRARAERIPEATHGGRLGRRERREGEPGRDGEERREREPEGDPPTGSLIDLQA